MNARRQRTLAKLSPRARLLYARVARGWWYPADDAGTPKAMAELVAAGLVVEQMRIKVVELCYVPAGAKPFRWERLPAVAP